MPPEKGKGMLVAMEKLKIIEARKKDRVQCLFLLQLK